METIAVGECLNYAWKTYIVKQDDEVANNTIKIVFGTVQNEWISKGRRYRHAWVEENGLVKDWQTMELGMSKWAYIGWNKDYYYESWSPKDLKKYTPAEAAEMFRETQSMIGHDWEHKGGK